MLKCILVIVCQFEHIELVQNPNIESTYVCLNGKFGEFWEEEWL